MILRLVDRRSGADVQWSGLAGDNWPQLNRLVREIGDPTWPVDVVLVDDAEMVALNGHYRQQPAVTDVLSFSYLADQGVRVADLSLGRGFAATDLWREVAPGGEDQSSVVGELVLAPEFVAARCGEHGWPLDQEVSLLLVHGCLHLVGWDHEEPAEQRAMQELEMEILAGEGLPHPLRPRS